MKSMTGYAQAEYVCASMRFAMELKSYNNRYLDIYLQLPAALSALEPLIRGWLQERLGRGKVEFSLRVREWLQPVSVTVDKAAAQAAINALRDLAQIAGGTETPGLGNLIQMDGVLSMERDINSDRIWEEVEPSLSALFGSYDETRLSEGGRLARDMKSQADLIQSELEGINACVPELERNIKEGLKRRFMEVLGNSVDEARVLQETAVALTRFTINEELIRLSSHLKALAQAILSNPQPGKILDFLCQEMNREINTIGSKSQLMETAGKVVLIKEAIENIREQARNVI